MHCTIKRIEAMDDKFLIHVEIAGKSYGIRINRSEEQVAREAFQPYADSRFPRAVPG